MFTHNPNTKLDASPPEACAANIDTRPKGTSVCGAQSGCTGLRCFLKATSSELASGEPEVGNRGPQSAKAARTARLAALKRDFDPNELAKLEDHTLAHFLATARYLDPNCQLIQQLVEQVKDEFWAPWAEANLNRLRRQPIVKTGHARKRTRKIKPDPMLRSDLFRDLEVPLPPSPLIEKVQDSTTRVAAEMAGDLMKVDEVPIVGDIEQDVSVGAAAELIHYG